MTPSASDPLHTFTRDALVDALTRLEIKVQLTGPIAGMVNAESMADAIIEALGQSRGLGLPAGPPDSKGRK